MKVVHGGVLDKMMSDDQKHTKFLKIVENQPTTSGLINIPKGRIGLKGIQIDDRVEQMESELKCR